MPHPSSQPTLSHPIKDMFETNDTEVECCPICQEPPSNSVKTPCKHLFCNECLTQWLLTHNTCPSCRFPIGANELGDESEIEDIDDELSFSIIDTGEIPENIYEQIELRVEDLVENVYYDSDELRYKWSLDEDNGYYTRIKRRGVAYTIRLNILSMRTNRYVKYIFPEIITEYYNIGLEAKKEKTKKYKTESWRFSKKNNKSRFVKTR